MYGIARRAAADRMGGAAGCPATRTRSRCASATPRTASSSSTSSARSWTRCTRRAAAGSAPTSRAGTLQLALLEHLEKIWREPDEGIWEVRGGRAALHLFQGDGLGRLRPRDQERRDVRPGRRRSSAGASCATRSTTRSAATASIAELGSFVQSYGSKELDASLLLLPLVGFLPADDPRMRGTVAAIERDLCVDGFVLRYDTGDGRRRPAAGRGRVPRLQLLAGRRLRPAGPPRRRARAVRAAARRCATTSAC